MLLNGHSDKQCTDRAVVTSFRQACSKSLKAGQKIIGGCDIDNISLPASISGCTHLLVLSIQSWSHSCRIKHDGGAGISDSHFTCKPATERMSSKLQTVNINLPRCKKFLYQRRSDIDLKSIIPKCR